MQNRPIGALPKRLRAVRSSGDQPEPGCVMDEYEEADSERNRLFRTPCGFCDQAPGFWCVDASGREISNVNGQHNVGYGQPGVKRGVLRALCTKAGLA